MFCSKCGQKLDEGVKFCNKCGNKVVGNIPENSIDNHEKLDIGSSMVEIPKKHEHQKIKSVNQQQFIPIKFNIKKVLLIASVGVILLLFIASLIPFIDVIVVSDNKILTGKPLFIEIYPEFLTINGYTNPRKNISQIKIPHEVDYAMRTAKNDAKNDTVIDSLIREYGNFNIRSIFISKSDVYIAGFFGNMLDPYQFLNKAVYWKNETMIILPCGNNKGSTAETIFISGNNVYIYGSVKLDRVAPNGALYANKYGYWKNDDFIPFTDSRKNSMFVSNNDLFFIGSASGTDNVNAVYWKNDQMITLPSIDKRNKNWKIVKAYSINIIGDDIYVSGLFSNDGNYKAVLWKNGRVRKEYKLNEIDDIENIFIVKRNAFSFININK